MDITFTDYYRLTKPTVEQVDEWKDYLGSSTAFGNKGLRIIMEATHAGLLNLNDRLYIPSRMAEGVSTFRTGEKPTKIIKHHDLHSDPVGVIRGARFVPTVPDELEDNPDVQNLMSSSAPIKTQLKSIRNLWRAGVFHQDGWRGLGYIQLIGDVYDTTTIDQVNNGLFDAVSTNFQSPGATHCLICAQNWATDGFCEHDWGEMYTEEDDDEDGFKFPAIAIPGVHQYLETSFTAFEADKLATVEVVDRTNTDNNKTIFLPDNFNWEGNLADSTEPIYEFRDFEEDKMANPVKGKNTLSDAEQKVFDVIKKLRSDTKDAILNDFAKKISAMYDKNNHLPYQTDAELDDETAILYTLEDLETADQTIDDAKIEEIENLYQEEFQKMSEEDLLTDEQLEDAKLSTKKRKSLPKTVFCGPNRSFPISDCAHAIAAKRLIGRYQGPGNKADILAGINRRATALGCSNSNDNVDPKPSIEVAKLVPGTKDSLKDIKDNDLQSLHLAIEVELVKRGKKMAYECKECALSDDKLKLAVEELAGVQSIVHEHEDTLIILRNELARTQVEYVDLVDQQVELSASVFADKLEKFAQIGVLSGKYDNLDNAREVIRTEDMEKVEASCADFDWKAAAEKLNDGMSNTPNSTVDDPTINTDSDNTQLPTDLSGPAEEAAENIRELIADGKTRNAKHIYATMKKLKLFPDEMTFESFSAVTIEKPADN